MGAKLLAVVAEGAKSRVYLSPTADMEVVARSEEPKWKPDVEFFQHALGFRVGNYGMTKWSDLFTSRQLAALTTFSGLVLEAREQVMRDARGAGVSHDDHALNDRGKAVTAYADAVCVYLALGVSKLADYNASLVQWSNSRDQAVHVFGRQALPMVWDY